MTRAPRVNFSKVREMAPYRNAPRAIYVGAPGRGKCCSARNSSSTLSVCPPRQLGIMGRHDIFANVIVMTPPEHADKIYAATDVFINRDENLAAGISHLPNRAGLLYKVVGPETGPVKKLVREFCSKIRTEVKGKPVPAEFPWR